MPVIDTTPPPTAMTSACALPPSSMQDGGEVSALQLMFTLAFPLMVSSAALPPVPSEAAFSTLPAQMDTAKLEGGVAASATVMVFCRLDRGKFCTTVVPALVKEEVKLLVAHADDGADNDLI